MNKTRKLRAAKGTIRVALTSGHVMLLTEEPRDVSDIFWKEAYALGAISGDMVETTIAERELKVKEDIRIKEEEELKELTTVLKGLIDSPKGAVDKNNLPLVRKVSAMLGRPVKKPIMLKIWAELLNIED